MRAWTVRLLGDARSVSPRIQERLVERARIELEAEVRSQLAASAKRLPARQAFPILRELLLRSEDVDDVKIPLLLWWAIEDKARSDRELVLELASDREVWQAPIFRQSVASRLGQRYAAERGDRHYYTLKQGVYSEWLHNYSPQVVERNLTTCVRLLERAPGPREIDLLVAGMEEGLRGEAVREVPSRLRDQVGRIWRARLRTPVLIRFAARLGHEGAAAVAVERLVRIILHGKEGERMRMVMPPLANLEDGQVAAILTYIRREWGQNTEPVPAELVARIRQLSAGRRGAWTEKELQKFLE